MGHILFICCRGAFTRSVAFTFMAMKVEIHYLFFSIRLVGGGVQLGPLSTAATDWPLVPAPDNYDDGEFMALP
jgi:hypothetical protein